MNSKCEMARLRYCNKSSMGCCNAEDKDIDKCPYLNAIGEIARLIVEAEMNKSSHNKRIKCCDCNIDFWYKENDVKRYVSKSGIIDYDYVNCPVCGRTYFINNL